MTRLIRLTAVVVCGLAGPAVAQPKPDDSLKQILADWTARQGKVRTARYVLSGTEEMVGGETPDYVLPPASDRVRPFRAVLILDTARGRFRQEKDGFEFRGGGKYVAMTSSTTYDGRERRMGRPRAQAAEHGWFDLIITDRSEWQNGGPAPWHPVWPLLYAHGLVPTSLVPVGFARLPHAYDPADWAFAGLRTLGPRQARVVRSEPTHHRPPLVDEFWVDPTPGRLSPVVRHVHTSSHPSDRTDIGWQVTPAGWWPTGWTTTMTGASGETLTVTKYRVESYEFDGPVADGEFTIPAEPGMERVIVNEPEPAGAGVVGPARRTYRITPSGRWVELEALGALTQDGFLPVARPWWRHWPWATAVVAAVVGVWWWRRGRAVVGSAT